MKFDAEQFRIQPDKRVELAHQPTHVAPLYASKADYQNLLAAQVAELSALQEVFYAASSHAVLFIFQAMDAAGKDSTIRHVMSGVNPQGCQVHSFKHPSASELEHDFLWRTTRELPERGLIGIFNRSYYEEVLIVRVHPEMLSNQGILQHNGERAVFWRDRFRSIVDFEHHLFRNG
ncbi:MAG: polyphosphate kinase 2 family protein, partial [Betaproteobacteria bacterium]|nr:polyphosphate kinase 2 family protein [Betaproteobacteria bacterium]